VLFQGCTCIRVACACVCVCVVRSMSQLDRRSASRSWRVATCCPLVDLALFVVVVVVLLSLPSPVLLSVPYAPTDSPSPAPSLSPNSWMFQATPSITTLPHYCHALHHAALFVDYQQHSLQLVCTIARCAASHCLDLLVVC
jgi:hypothetical protein